ncbi:somatoliberin [Tachyglossus aculeatus]|uniref:somatoliberin n=1 Tax=Tachyglossus aculeatus TaxID=9261 RepID=UPI0018F50C48|nr:somatoliberin [Tachyglossus aculeatus]
MPGRRGVSRGSGLRPPLLLLLLPLMLLVQPIALRPARRVHRHADAIFTNSYRKVLGQISARKLLQRLGREGRPEEEDVDDKQEVVGRRQSDSILMDSYYHRRTVLRDFLEAALRERRRVGAGARSPRAPCPEGQLGPCPRLPSAS